MKKVLQSSILAGIMIAISTLGYLHNPSIVGAVLFSAGLLAILDCRFDLFTGKVPYMKSYKELPYILTVLVGNIIGCSILFFCPVEAAKEQLALALNKDTVTIVVTSIMCNILIYVAVEGYNKSDFALVILAVTLFIMCGFNHSIARICLAIAARTFNLQILSYLVIVIIGNAFGGIVFHRLREKSIE